MNTPNTKRAIEEKIIDDLVTNAFANNNNSPSLKHIGLIGLTTLGIGISTFVGLRYRTARSNEWLVRTGFGIEDMQIGKKFVRLPFQDIATITMTPKTCKFTINAMSIEKLEFNFPAVFTVSPRNSQESLKIYARYLVTQKSASLEDMIISIIEGETRALAANSPIEEIFSGRTEFKKAITESVQTHLDKFGLEILNANLERLEDSKDSNYFLNLSRKINSEAENLAITQVALNEKNGEIGRQTHEGEKRRKTAEIEAETKIYENQKKQEILKSLTELEKFEAEQKLITEIANIQSLNKANEYRLETEKDVEIRRGLMELEKKRAIDLTETTVKAETELKRAEGEANAQKVLADALLYSKLKEAESVRALYEAQASGLEKLIGTFGGNPEAYLKYKMLETGTYEKIAQTNAEAVRGLKPKINVWTHDPTKAFDPIQNLGKSIIPMMGVIESQTDYKFPDWMKKSNIDTCI